MNSIITNILENKEARDQSAVEALALQTTTAAPWLA